MSLVYTGERRIAAEKAKPEQRVPVRTLKNAQLHSPVNASASCSRDFEAQRERRQRRQRLTTQSARGAAAKAKVRAIV